MSLQKVPQSLPSSWFLLASLQNKKLGVLQLKDPMFQEAFLSQQKAFDDCLSALADRVRVIATANRDKLPTAPPAKKKSATKSKSKGKIETLSASEDSGGDEDVVSEDLSDDDGDAVIAERLSKLHGRKGKKPAPPAKPAKPSKSAKKVADSSQPA